MFLFHDEKEIYYEKTGSGRPIILLHGNGESLTIFRDCINILKSSFTVYAVDMAGHGCSYRPNELHYESHAEDIHTLIQSLSLHKPILYGFSDGGIVGLLLAIKYPHLLSKLIVSGVNIHPDGLTFPVRLATAIRYLVTRSQKARMMLEEPQITPDDLANIQVPTFLTVGEYDCIRFRHTRYICDHIKDCHLHIFKRHLHGSYVVHSKLIAQYILSTEDLV